MCRALVWIVSGRGIASHLGLSIKCEVKVCNIKVMKGVSWGYNLGCGYNGNSALLHNFL